MGGNDYYNLYNGGTDSYDKDESSLLNQKDLLLSGRIT